MAGEAKTTRWGIVESWTKIGPDSDKSATPDRGLGGFVLAGQKAKSGKQNLSTEQRGKTEWQK